MTSDRRHDSWAEEALAAHERPLLRYVQRILGDVERSRDVVQEAFLKMWKAGRGGVGDNLAAWLYTVCRNLAIDVTRKERRMVLTDPVRLPEPQESPCGASGGELDEILRALGGLPANQQEVLRLKFQGGLSYKDISQVTGLSVSNVGFLMHTGIKALRQVAVGGRARKGGAK